MILGHNERALWFSRCPVVYDRDHARPTTTCHRHLGIYAYRREVLLNYAALPPSGLEQLEKLEQLRALDAGIGIACAEVSHAQPGIDVRADYDAFLARLKTGTNGVNKVTEVWRDLVPVPWLAIAGSETLFASSDKLKGALV